MVLIASTPCNEDWSAIRWQAVREARDRWPLPYGHVDILSSPEASQLLNEILVALEK